MFSHHQGLAMTPNTCMVGVGTGEVNPRPHFSGNALLLEFSCPTLWPPRAKNMLKVEVGTKPSTFSAYSPASCPLLMALCPLTYWESDPQTKVYQCLALMFKGSNGSLSFMLDQSQGFIRKFCFSTIFCRKMYLELFCGWRRIEKSQSLTHILI